MAGWLGSAGTTTGCEANGATKDGWSPNKIIVATGANTAHPFHGIDMGSGNKINAWGSTLRAPAFGDVDNDGQWRSGGGATVESPRGARGCAYPQGSIRRDVTSDTCSVLCEQATWTWS